MEPVYKSWRQEDPPRRVDGFEDIHSYRHKRCLIGIEEHCSVPIDFPDRPSTAHFAEEYKFRRAWMEDVVNRLIDVDLRVKTMNKCGMAAQLLSLAEPGCQGFSADELEKSVRFARAANEFMHQTYCKKYPDRFFGLAAVPTQDGQAAADELERCVKEYGFKGCLINGFTPTSNAADNLYLDMPMYEPFWAKVAELDVPVFIHPRAPAREQFHLGEKYPALKAPTYGFTRETVEHCLRVMCSGVFDRYPTVKVVLGHLGEGLSFALPRLDHRMRIMEEGSSGPHKKPLGYYFQNNFICLTSGHFTTSALHQLIAETNTKTVLYSDDYPFESIEEHVEWWRTIGVGEETWKDMSYRNAIRLFKLPLNFDDE